MKTFLQLTHRQPAPLPPAFQHDDVRYAPELVQTFLEEYTRPGQLVFDPFAGFGATLVVAEALDQEERQFKRTLERGLRQYHKVAERAQQSGEQRVPGEAAFDLFETYGFPQSLTVELAREQGLSVDEARFAALYEEHKALSRRGVDRKFKGGLVDQSETTTRLHTATHLLHAALRRVLGPAVRQMGSNITPERLRFDFSHPARLTPAELGQVEALVNEQIQADLPVSVDLLPLDEALAAGALAFFGEKYGEQVKVYSVGGFSKEVCGGPPRHPHRPARPPARGEGGGRRPGRAAGAGGVRSQRVKTVWVCECVRGFTHTPTHPHTFLHFYTPPFPHIILPRNPPMTQPSALGRPTPMIDGRAKVLGAALYTPDLSLPGLLHARLVTSLYPHARLLGIDAAAALAMPGVIAVLTAADLPVQVASSRTKLLLARERVIFAGQPVALVLATSEAAAHDAALLVQVDYEPLPAAMTMDDALAEGAPLVWPDGLPNGEGEGGAHGAAVEGGDKEGPARHGNLAKEGGYTRGDVAAGFAEADIIIERTFNTPMVHQSPVETQAVVVQPDPVTGGADIWASTQGPFGIRREVAAALDVAESDVRVRGMTVGGGFGSKNGLYEPLVALAARAVRRPVRLWLTRSEEMLAANPAPPVRIHGRLGARRDGTLTALECLVTVDGGCYPFDLGKFLAFMFGSLYRIPNLSLQGRDVLTFKPSAGPYRAPGAPTMTFALDCLMDELARALEVDPLEFRLRHAARAGDLMPNDEPWPSMGMTAVLEALRQHPAWQNRAQARAQGRGVGIGIGGWLGGTEPAAAVCQLQRDGTLQVHVGSVDLNGTATGFALLAAETFGIAPEKVRVLISDTATAPYSGASAGSKVTYATGSAVVNAAREARRQVLALVADELEAAVEDLEIVNGQVQVRGAPDRGIPFSALAEKTYEWGSKLAPVYGAGRFAVSDSAPAFNAQLAEVEVDRDTGQVRVHRLVVVQDVGRVINPLAIQGQLRGGATQGLGWALYEQMLYDEQGQLVTGTLMDYTLPSISQTAPDIDTVLVEVPSEHGPFGARGVGEAPVVPTAAAVTNAIADLTGVRFSDLPLTPPKVWAALAGRAA